MSSSPPVPTRQKLLLGCSPIGLPAAEFLRLELDDIAEITTWCQGEPAPLATAYDLAAFVVSSERESALMFRLGVFLGALGRERVVICPVSNAVELPPDLYGLPVAHDAGALKERLRQLAAATAPAASVPHPAGPVARRMRRSLGTASSSQAGRPLRIADISLTGALLETFGEIPENQMLDLEFALDNGRRIRVAARVVRVQYPQWGRVGGVGVQFVRFEGASQAELANYLEATMS
jgi:hypothetical protein